MKNLALIFVGESLLNSPIFCDEVRNQIAKTVTIPEIEARYPESSSEVHHLIGFLAQNPCEIVIICTPKIYPQFRKYFASLALVLSEESDAKSPTFSLQFAQARLQLHALDECAEIPHFTLLGFPQPLTLCLMGIDKDSAQLLLGPLAQEYGYSLHAFTPFLGANMLSAKEITQTRADKKTGAIPQAREVPQSTGNQGRFLEEIALLFGDKIFPLENLAQKLVDELKKRQKIVVTAESCTGGGVAKLLTHISGSSEVFHGGVISYDNSVKARWLGVKPETLRLYGAVSEPTLKEMLRGALRVLPKAHYALATSGIAGPTGGSANKPVGTVFIGVCAREGEMLVEQIPFAGNRERIQQQASHYALYLLLRTLMKT
ncbi:MAG: CinA family protein [Wolinella sp.]